MIHSLLFTLCLLLLASGLRAQDDPYSEIEVWGLENMSRAEFFALHEERNLSICAESLRQLGYEDGNRIMLKGGGQILTLRAYPDYDWLPRKRAKRTMPIVNPWRPLLALDVHSIECQLAHRYYPYFLAGDSRAIDSLLAEHYRSFRWYGMKQSPELMNRYCEIMQDLSHQVDLSEVLNILLHADSSSRKLKLAASFALPVLVHTHEEALQVMPLLFDPEGGRIQNALRYFYLQPGRQVNWEPQLPFLAQVLRHPDPLVLKDLLEILDHTGFRAEWSPILLRQGSDTMLEVLASQKAKVWQRNLIGFLRKYAPEDVGESPQAWIGYIQGLKHIQRSDR